MKTNLFDEAKKYIPGGVNSPVRAFGSVGGDPIFIDHALGAMVYDTEGKGYIDYVCSWGPLILGHADRDINKAVLDALGKGTSFGAPTQAETILAKSIVNLVPAIEKVRLVSSGTEAVMSAIRLARAFTKRDKVIKFEGCYHGHSDFMLVKAGSGLLTYGETSSLGVPKDIANFTLIAQYNDIDSVRKIFEMNKGEIAAIIVEPIAANMGLVLPNDNFLAELRKITTENDSLLIFDEVITGFRLASGGANEYFNITPDLITLGKIIGGGLPVGAFGGRAEILDMLSPIGAVYQAGTLSGNPLAMAAGIKMLEKISQPNFHKTLKTNSQHLYDGLEDNLKKLNLNYTFNYIESLSCLYFTENKVNSYQSAIKSDTDKYAKYFHHMLDNGIYLAPAQFESAFVSAAHSDLHIEKTIKTNYEALKKL